MKNKHNKKPLRFSIRTKILMLAAAVSVPFLIAVITLLISMDHYAGRYDSIVRNMTVANNYNLNFKEEMDESLYKLVVGYVDYEHIDEDRSLKDPYVLIQELQAAFSELADITTQAESRMWLESLLRNIDTLKKRVDDIMENIREGGKYDQNIQELDNNIYILTELIQDDIQYYIYYQTQSMGEINAALYKQNRRFMIIIALIVIVLAVSGVIFAVSLVSGIVGPIDDLYEAAERVGKGDFAARAHVKSDDELAVLAQGFNTMAGHMQDLIDQTKENERKLRRMDLRLLQEQINPHFLYNTLDTIVWLIEVNEKDQAVSMIMSLSNLFRQVLSKGKEFITIREEEQHITSYLEIQGMRYQDIMDYQIEIDQVAGQYMIPKLTLQPLVENALYHGLKYKRAKGSIFIHGEKDEDMIRLIVRDNGVGMDEQELAQLKEEISHPCNETDKGFGLSNVNERIRMYFGSQYGMKIQSVKGKGTTVEILIPAVLQGKQEPDSVRQD